MRWLAPAELVTVVQGTVVERVTVSVITLTEGLGMIICAVEVDLGAAEEVGDAAGGVLIRVETEVLVMTDLMVEVVMEMKV